MKKYSLYILSMSIAFHPPIYKSIQNEKRYNSYDTSKGAPAYQQLMLKDLFDQHISDPRKI